MKRNIIPLFLAIIIISVDQYIKYLVLKTTSIGEYFLFKKILIIKPEIFNDSVYNSYSLNLVSLIIIPIIVIIILLFILFRSKNLNYIQRYSLFLIIGGNCSYLIDRFLRSLNLLKFIKVPNFTFIPTFNIADLAVVIGGIVVLLSLIPKERR